jgi:predicted HTH transcriptional regulator
VDAFIASTRAEDRAIEYKLDLPGGNEDRREFLRDGSAFANALGGDILYGIEENAGLPTAAPGVSVPKVPRQANPG